MYEDDIKQWYMRNANNSCTFDGFVSYCKNRYYTEKNPVTKKKNAKLLGDLFESFCKMYLVNVCKFSEVWYLKEVPVDIKSALHLEKRDFGIDIVAFDGSEFHAIQCKYRTRNKLTTRTGVTWKDLSTFYAIVTKTGPFKSHIVMTNVDYVTQIGEKTDKDRSICYDTFRHITGDIWKDVLGLVNSSNLTTPPTITMDEMREKRLAYFDKEALELTNRDNI